MTTAVEVYHRPVPLRTDYETPVSTFAPLDAEFRFTLDVCATAENAKCARYFTPEDDGLSREWDRDGGACWMNPPYGREIGAWMRKAWEESRRGAVVVCLVPARTDSAWWHDYAMRGEIRFIRGRIRFVGTRYSAPFPCAVVVFRPSEAA
ncbi:MAG TPA: DNA N-6-adenine-methyltransferase [Gemmatimonadaceae bacterium]|nr:DNA N-6-adenine-methyltransferase [Gemmatimonadaceae bacterium]